MQGTLGGEIIRRSLDLTSWQAAADRVRSWEASGTIGVVKAEIPTIREAVAKYLADAEARKLAPESIKKLRYTLEKRLVEFSAGEGLRYLKQLDLDRLREFRGTWTYSPIAARKRLETVRGFFRFCVQSGWIQANPATLIKPAKHKDTSTLPFMAEQMAAVLAAADKFWARGIYGKGSRKGTARSFYCCATAGSESWTPCVLRNLASSASDLFCTRRRQARRSASLFLRKC